MIEADKQAFFEKFVAHPTVEGLDEAVLHRSPWRDGMPVQTLVLCPARHRVRGELGAVVETIICGLPREPMNIVSSRSTRLPEIEVSGIAARNSRVTASTKDAEASALGELVMDEVERPARVDLGSPTVSTTVVWNPRVAPYRDPG